jgi:CheY-like chemotaxis protein
MTALLQHSEHLKTLANKRVLVVDDEADIRDLLRVILESCDVHVLEAASAAEAMTVVHAEPLDMIISDIGMPGQDGYALIADVRKLPAYARVPAIALTAFARSHDRRRALAAGFDLHMTKPIRMTELLLALVTLLNRTQPV